MKNVVKFDEIRDKLSTSHFGCNHQNWKFSFRKVLLKYEPRIKDKELHDKDKHMQKFILFLRFKRNFI